MLRREDEVNYDRQGRVNNDRKYKSQNVISCKDKLFEGQGGGRRTLPYAFTEQGIYMLATVLRGELAEQQSIFIMRAFVYRERTWTKGIFDHSSGK